MAEHGNLYEAAEEHSEAMSIVGPAMELAHWAGEYKGLAPELPGMSALEHGSKAASVASGVVNAGMAIDDFAEHGFHNQEAYNRAGAAALSAAEMIPVVGSFVSAAEIGTNALGSATSAVFGKDAGFSADQVAGGLVRNTYGDESTGWKAGSAVSDALGGGALGTAAGVMAGAATEVLAMPFDTGKAVIKGLGHEASAIGDSIMGRDHKLVDPKFLASLQHKSQEAEEKKRQKQSLDEMNMWMSIANADVQMGLSTAQAQNAAKAAKAGPAAAPAPAKPAAGRHKRRRRHHHAAHPHHHRKHAAHGHHPHHRRHG